MEKSWRIIDATLLVTLISGLLYFLGYQYLLHYYNYFGLNIQVREPSVQLVICRGSFFVEYLLAALSIAVIAYALARQVLQRIARSFNRQIPTLLPIVSISCGLFVFIVLFQKIEIPIQKTAYQSAQAAIKFRRSAPSDVILLKDGSTLPGNLRLHFIGPTFAVFMDFSPRPNSPNSRVVVVPLSEIRAITH